MKIHKATQAASKGFFSLLEETGLSAFYAMQGWGIINHTDRIWGKQLNW
jgi:hypothetical protein